jgi:hypothetical protein
MHIRTRKFIGGFLILAVLAVYSLVAMVVGAAVAMDWPEPGRVAFYGVAPECSFPARGSASRGWRS